MKTISRILTYCQRELFPSLEDDFGVLSDPLKQVIRAIELTPVEDFVKRKPQGLRGRPMHDRSAIARAFIAKGILKLPDTRALLDYLDSSTALRKICGWFRRSQVPSEATFSRAFAEFAETDVAGLLHHKAIVEFFDGHIVGHISRDSTDIHAREKPAPKPPKKKGPRYPVGRPKKSEQRPPKEPTRIERQLEMTTAEMIADLPQSCDVGCKTKGRSKNSTWVGYKLHIDFADGEIPVSCILSSASVHDSQVAIPLADLTAARVDSLYDLMDAAYDVEAIHQYCRALGHVPIIDDNPRRGTEKRQMDPAKARRYRIRATAERGNSRLKDSFGARFVRVRGPTKVFAHLMFGVLALTLDQIARTLSLSA